MYVRKENKVLWRIFGSKGEAVNKNRENYS
jgi:hypothetical protein